MATLLQLTPTNTAIALLDAWIAHDRASMLGKIDNPTLIVSASYSGDQKYLETRREMQKRIHGSRLEIFEDAAHALFVDDADRFNSLLDEFRAGVVR